MLHRRNSTENYTIDWVRSKPLLAVVGILEPGMAIVSAMGFLLLIGAPYNDTVIVMPFLVFGKFLSIHYVNKISLSYLVGIKLMFYFSSFRYLMKWRDKIFILIHL